MILKKKNKISISKNKMQKSKIFVIYDSLKMLERFYKRTD